MPNTTFSLSGTLTPQGHLLTQRVYYEDTDFSGLVYHARYLHFLERGRTDFLRCLGIGQAEMAASDERLVFVVHRMEIDFKSSARMDDILTIRTMTEQARGAKLILGQEIRREDVLLTAARVTVAVLNERGRPQRLPAAIIENFAPALA